MKAGSSCIKIETIEISFLIEIIVDPNDALALIKIDVMTMGQFIVVFQIARKTKGKLTRELGKALFDTKPHFVIGNLDAPPRSAPNKPEIICFHLETLKLLPSQKLPFPQSLWEGLCPQKSSHNRPDKLPGRV